VRAPSFRHPASGAKPAAGPRSKDSPSQAGGRDPDASGVVVAGRDGRPQQVHPLPKRGVWIEEARVTGAPQPRAFVGYGAELEL